jgi:hypothetical protein
MTPKQQAIAKAAVFRAYLVNAEKEAREARAMAVDLARPDLVEAIDRIIRPLHVAHHRANDVAVMLGGDNAYGGGPVAYSGGDDKPDDEPPPPSGP